jgi:hypothetical protein
MESDWSVDLPAVMVLNVFVRAWNVWAIALEALHSLETWMKILRDSPTSLRVAPGDSVIAFNMRVWDGSLIAVH